MGSQHLHLAHHQRQAVTFQVDQEAGEHSRTLLPDLRPLQLDLLLRLLVHLLLLDNLPAVPLEALG